MSTSTASDHRFGIGQALTRLEDDRLLTGQGRFADDVSAPDALHLELVRSPYAHARILSIDTSAALDMPGVVAVYTGADLIAAGCLPLVGRPGLKRPDGQPMSSPDRYPLSPDAARYVGEAVAAVVAQTKQQAMDAAEAVMVDWDPQPAVTSVASALADDAPLVDPNTPRNITAAARYGDAQAVAAAFAQAACTVSVDIDNQRLIPMALEPRACLARWEAGQDGTAAAAGRLTLHASTQNPTASRQTLADRILRLPVDRIRVLVDDVGGGFGMKSGLYPEEAVCAFAAKTLGRAVRWRASRSEEFLAGGHGRAQRTQAELALDASGKILALRGRIDGIVGPYANVVSPAIHTALSAKVICSVYQVPQIDLQCQAVLAHTGTVHAYRGAGRPEAIFAIERLMDEAAHAMQMDPAELRRRNLVPADAMPYRSAVGEVYDSGNFQRLLDQILQQADWQGFEARRQASATRGKLRGRAVSTFLEWTGGGALSETVSLRVIPPTDTAPGRLQMWTATQAMGQGLHTTYAQIIAQSLGIDPTQIEFRQGDTDQANGFGSMGSRSLFVGGSAVQGAAHALERKGRDLAADALEVAAADLEFKLGRWEVAGTDLSIGLFDLARQLHDAGQPDALALSDSTQVGAMSWPNGTHVCELEVDPDTGEVCIDRYFTVDDVGTVINPMIVAGQVHGGIVQAVGQALFEHAIYDDEGQMLTGSLMDYAVPRAADVPFFSTATDQTQPCKTNPLGAKGVGELGTVGGTPTVVNAVLNALRPLGVADLQMPLTPARIWQACEQARSAQPAKAA